MAVINAITIDRNVSADIVATAGTPVTIFLSSATDEQISADAMAWIEIKSAGGKYFGLPSGILNTNNPARVIDGPCTFRVIKGPGGVAFGVEQG